MCIKGMLELHCLGILQVPASSSRENKYLQLPGAQALN